MYMYIYCKQHMKAKSQCTNTAKYACMHACMYDAYTSNLSAVQTDRPDLRHTHTCTEACFPKILHTKRKIHVPVH